MTMTGTTRAVIIALLMALLAFAAGCENIEKPTSEKAVAEKPAACTSGETKCDGDARIMQCTDGAWKVVKSCTIREACTSGPSGFSCVAYPEMAYSLPSAFEEATTLGHIQPQQLVNPQWPLLRISHRLAKNYTPKLRPGQRAPAPPKDQRISMDDPAQRALVRSLFAEAIDGVAAIVGKKPAFAAGFPAPSLALPQPIRNDFSLWEDTELKITESPSKQRLVATYKSLTASESENALPTIILALGVASGMNVMSGEQVNLPRVYESSSKLAGIGIDFRLRCAHKEGCGELFGELKKLAARLTYAMSAFYSESRVTRTWTLCTQPEFVDTLVAKGGSGWSKLAKQITCDDACGKAVNALDGALRGYARQELSPENTTATLDAMDIATLAKAKNGLLCAGLADTLAGANKIDVALAPDSSLGPGKLLPLWQKAMAPDTYVDWLLKMADADPATFTIWLSGLLTVPSETLAARFAPMASKKLDDAEFEAFMYWVRRSTNKAAPVVIKYFERLSATPARRDQLLDSLSRVYDDKIQDFLLKRLSKGDTSGKMLSKLLKQGRTRPAAFAAALKGIARLPTPSARALLQHIYDLRNQPANRWKPDPKPAVRKLMAKTTDFEIYKQCALVLGVLSGKDWRWPKRPQLVDLYATGEADDTQLLERMDAAVEALGTLSKEKLIELYALRPIAPPVAHGRLVNLFVRLATADKKLVAAESKRIAKLVKSPAISGLAEDVLTKLRGK